MVHSVIASSSISLLLRAAVVAGELRVFAQIGPVDGDHQTLEDAVAVAGDDDVAAVLAEVGIGRRDPGQAGAGALTNVAETGKLGDQALHDPEDRFVQSHIDELAFAAVDLEVIHRHEGTDDAIERCQRVPDAHAHPHRRPVRVAGEVA